MTNLLPPNASKLEKALVYAVQLPASPTPYRSLWLPNDCPLELLPWLAWSLGVRTWLPEWPEAVKRDRVRQAIPLKRRLGTRKSVEDVIAALGAAAFIREWFETTPPGEPRTFGVVVTIDNVHGTPSSAAFINSIIADIIRAKPLAAHFNFTQAITARARIGLTVNARFATLARLSLST